MSRPFVLFLMLLLGGAGQVRAAPEVEVGATLDHLAQRHGFSVSGRELARGHLGRLRAGGLERRLRHLLAGLDHVILRTPDGRVVRVILVGARRTPGAISGAPLPEAAPLQLPLRRKGAAWVVVLTLESGDAAPRRQPLLLDTGATRTLLPARVCAELGLDLEAPPVAIALGGAEVLARPGRLTAVRAGPRRLLEVEVGCVEGRALGGNALLGEDLFERLGARLDRDGARLLLDPAPGD
ncbi:retropepsin-like aspartic protease [Marichromatium bheemlicum]|uniref:Aspartyl protease n=1 Tax=Marichromatium bheemlicum TaxID=365339 RepID=A0ABX1I474_9GAMM|nr:retropepsin-like aspartic protease [Marichromatium bheemlicum]NKN31654.1 hypothetical protein [Marichromatium bheemlicum]